MYYLCIYCNIVRSTVWCTWYPSKISNRITVKNINPSIILPTLFGILFIRHVLCVPLVSVNDIHNMNSNEQRCGGKQVFEEKNYFLIINVITDVTDINFVYMRHDANNCKLFPTYKAELISISPHTRVLALTGGVLVIRTP